MIGGDRRKDEALIFDFQCIYVRNSFHRRERDAVSDIIFAAAECVYMVQGSTRIYHRGERI